MRRRIVIAPVWLVLAIFSPGPVFTLLAQTPGATPVATPVASEPPWSVTETRAIEVDGDPYVLSPAGRVGVDSGRRESGNRASGHGS